MLHHPDRRREVGMAKLQRGEHHLIHAVRGRVAVEGGQHIRVQPLAQPGQRLGELAHHLGGAPRQRLAIERFAVVARAVAQLDGGLRAQRLQRAVERVGNVEILACLAQLGRPQAQRVEHIGQGRSAQQHRALEQDAAQIKTDRALTGALIERLIDRIEVSHDKQITVRYRFQSEFETYAEVLEQCRNM